LPPNRIEQFNSVCGYALMAFCPKCSLTISAFAFFAYHS
jgi:hypothetical protein